MEKARATNESHLQTVQKPRAFRLAEVEMPAHPCTGFDARLQLQDLHKSSSIMTMHVPTNKKCNNNPYER
jgi:hypothetical protein